MDRRCFLKGTGCLALGAALPKATSAAALPSGKVKFCAFADIHHFPGYWPHGDSEFLEKILARADREKTDFVIQLGDFVHDLNLSKDYLDLYAGFGQPTYHVVGNHEGERQDLASTLKALKLENPYYFFERNGFRFVVVDPNYFLDTDGAYRHYESYNLHRATQAKRVAKGCVLPPEQEEWLKDAVTTSSLPCVVFLHESFERPGSVANGPALMDFFDETNARHPGRVRMVVNGHYHTDHVRVRNDIVYFDMNSASYQYFVKAHARYPAEYIATHRNSNHAIAWNDPLSAVVTLETGGKIRIEGSESTFFRGVTPEMAGLAPRDGLGRPTVPMISSFEFEKRFSV